MGTIGQGACHVCWRGPNSLIGANAYRIWREIRIQRAAADVQTNMYDPNALPLINNTGHSRQVRRAHEREGEKAELSSVLKAKLAQLYPGQGLFMQNYFGFGRTYYVGWPNETRKPNLDHSKRYAHLFKVPSDAADV
jgi:hypothetical protein